MAISSPIQTTSLRRILPKFTLIAFLSFVCADRYQAVEPEPANAAKVDTPTGSRSDSTVSRGDITDLQNLILQQHQAIEELKGKLAQQQALIDKLALERKADVAASSNAGSTVEVASLSANPPEAGGASATQTKTNVVATKDEKKPEDAPLQLKIGSAYITPVGFMDFTGFWRSRTGGSGIGTNFAAIPYGTSAFQANLGEFRFSMQNSRVGFRVDALVKGAHIMGYMESDFLGNNPGNVAVSSNSNTFRSRLFWIDFRKDKYEFLAGQTWSLMTPGRKGISPLPGDLFYTQLIDVNYSAGLFWGRIPEFRFVYHPNNKWAMAVAMDSPEQYIGGSAGGSTATFPAALTATYPGGELNNGATTLSVPNVAPDIIVKLAGDPNSRLHFELGGAVRQFRLYNPTNQNHYYAAGGGLFANLNVELFKGFRIVTNNYWSDGGGRYLFGQIPDLIAQADGSPSLIHAYSTVSGIEYVHKNTMFYGYYGGIYAQKNVAIDTNGKPVGYGYAGSPTGQNRNIQEPSFGMAQTFWKDPKYGALTFMFQYSWLVRHPWAVAAGQPSDANLNMVFINLRYSLPGSAPSMK